MSNRARISHLLLIGWVSTLVFVMSACAPTVAPTAVQSVTPKPTRTPEPTQATKPTATRVIQPKPTKTPVTEPTPSLLPITGTYVPTLGAYDRAMVSFMHERTIQAGTLTVMKDGVIVLSRGYGWLDQNHTKLVPPDALFRYASITKPITAAAIKTLIRQGKLTADTRVFPLLQITPESGKPDPRLKDVTVQNLLDHKGGWDINQLGYDPMFSSIKISQALGVVSPPSKLDIARYMAGQPLSFTPGTQEAYSNFGYMLLGLVIEKVSGRPYLQYVQQNLFDPLGIKDILDAHTLPKQRSPREPWYSDHNTCPNVFLPPKFPAVPCPDGGWDIEDMESHGGLIGSGPAMAKFMQAYWLTGDPRLPGESEDWLFYGSLDGAFTMARWRTDNVNIVALFNQRADASKLSYDTVKDVMDHVTAGISNWH